MQGAVERQDRVGGQVVWKHLTAVLEGGYIHYFLDVRAFVRAGGVHRQGERRGRRGG
jgi:hypothetical protein